MLLIKFSLNISFPFGSAVGPALASGNSSVFLRDEM